MSPSFPVWCNGALHPAATPLVPIEDQGLQLGLAVFETLLFEERCLYFVEAHLARLERGARAIGIPWPVPWRLAESLAGYVSALDAPSCAVRVTLTRGISGGSPNLLFSARERVPPPAEGARLWLSGERKEAADRFEGIKSTQRLRHVLALEEARANGCWDALIRTREGDVCEGTFCNLFAFTGGRLMTPALDRGCLAGVMRGVVLQSVQSAAPPWPVVEGRVELETLQRADEIFCTNTTGRVVPVRAVVGLRMDYPGPEGPMAQWVAERVRSAETAYRARAACGPPAH